MPDRGAAACPEDYRNPPPAATSDLAGEIATRIRESGPLGFQEFMAAALYDPRQGYYSSPLRVGRGGDFFTSVSTGGLFGALLARHFLAVYERCGAPPTWRVLETGANDGSLAADVLSEIHRISAAAFRALEYVILEPLATLRETQAARLAEFSATVHHAATADFLSPLPGAAFGNEVLDALPFHLIRREHGTWLERKIALDDAGNFRWQTVEISDPALLCAVRTLPDLPDGCMTEIRTNFPDFLAPLARSLTRGSMVWIDYGFARPEYYDVHRTSGTLRTFGRHRAGEDPLSCPGSRDITAHVDFTAAAEAGISLGALPAAFTSQGSWLTRLAAPDMSRLVSSPTLIRQFQTLVHPAHLGAKFHILEQTIGFSAEIPSDVRHRLAL